LAESFARNIWSQRMRCFPCHTPHELDRQNPKHQVPSQRYAELKKQFGAKMDLFQSTPEATMSRLIASSRRPVKGRYPLINLERPDKSLLVLKPTSKVPQKREDGTFAKPSSTDPVTHMGGLKMHVHDPSYKSFLLWLQDYARVVGDQYVAVEDLPADNWQPTQHVLRVQDVPPSWAGSAVVQLFVHARSAGGDGWTAEPVAFTQGTVTPRGLVVGALFLFQSETPDTPTAAAGERSRLQPGQYLIKACVDRSGKVADSPTLLLGADDFVGQTVIDAQWRIGFPNAETVSAERLKRPAQP
jgi:hypothetical protein